MTQLPKLSLVFGGASSGKSAFAEQLVCKTEANRVYIATAQVFDEEMKSKVASHRVMRGTEWTTIEEPRDMAAALGHAKNSDVVLLDCATMWLSNHLLAENNIDEETHGFLAALKSCPARIVVVSNEVGQGIVPDNALARRFRDAQGKLNQRLAEVSDLVVFVTAGLPQVLKGTLP